jgi:hypothetical protein
MYLIDYDLDDEILTKLKKYNDEELDLYDDNPFHNLFNNSCVIINGAKYNKCDFKLFRSIG